MNSSNWRPTAALLLLPALAALWLYWPSLSLPLIYDDLLHIRIAGDLTLWTVWLPTEAFGFYRPLTFFPLLIIERLWGYYPAWLLHGLNVGQHALNALLLALLVWRLWRRVSLGAAAGLLFAAYPFSYQAVAVYGHHVHPAATGLILLGLHSYLYLIRQAAAQWRWWAAAALLFALALLSHETAILFGPLAALVHLVEQAGQGQPIRSYLGRLRRQPVAFVRHYPYRNNPWLAFTLAGFLYLILYQFLPISRAPQSDLLDLAGLWLKGLYLAQGMAYPLAWLGGWLPAWPGSLLAVASFLLVAAAAANAALVRLRRRPLLMAWGWWGLVSLLIALPLPANYLLHGPRLLYLGGVGAALLWGWLLLPAWTYSRARQVVGVAALAAILLTSSLFVRERLAAYQQLTQPVNQVAAVMAERPAGEGVVLINLPQWTAPAQNRYPVGVELAAMMGDYLFAEELIGVNLRRDRPTLAFQVDELLSDPGYPYAVHNQTPTPQLRSDWAGTTSHLFITTYTAEGPQSRYAGRFIPLDATKPALAALGPYRLLDIDVNCRETIQVTTTWNIAGQETPGPALSLFVQLLDAGGRPISQADAPPLGLPANRIELAPGWGMVDNRELVGTEGDAGYLLIGAYDFSNGDRLPAQDAAQQPLPDNAFRLDLDDCRPAPTN